MGKIGRLLALLLVSARAAAVGPPAPPAVFSDFRYTGGDAADARPIRRGQYRNPILAGFRPDPSITFHDGYYYLATSSFAWWPALPIFRSRDLVAWEQIGAAIDRPGQMSLAGRFPSEGLYAPDLKVHDGIFHVLGTCMGCGGNFIATARDPAGPWSDPHWLPFDGIDPSLFVDDDGRAWIVNNGPPAGPPRWPGHRAIWLQEIDLATMTMIGPRTIIVDGGADPSTRPEWIEGPHLFRRDGFYYLIAAEGGTGARHSEVVFRATRLDGPWQAGPDNPILTQRDLRGDRPDAIGATGHADFRQTPDGAWWAVFLGVRPYAGDFYTTGRDTYLLPVTWADGWPSILGPGTPAPRIAERPALPAAPAPAVPTSGAFVLTDRFADGRVQRFWSTLRADGAGWWRSGGGALRIAPRPDELGTLGLPSLLAVRQAHAHATLSVRLAFSAAAVGQRAGVVAFQDERRWLSLAVGRSAAGLPELQIARRLRKEDPADGIVTARLAAPRRPVRLRLRIDGERLVFEAAFSSAGWRVVGTDSLRLLTTAEAGGFTGTMLGLFAVAPQPPRRPQRAGGR